MTHGHVAPTAVYYSIFQCVSEIKFPINFTRSLYIRLLRPPPSALIIWNSRNPNGNYFNSNPLLRFAYTYVQDCNMWTHDSVRSRSMVIYANWHGHRVPPRDLPLTAPIQPVFLHSRENHESRTATKVRTQYLQLLTFANCTSLWRLQCINRILI